MDERNTVLPGEAEPDADTEQSGGGVREIPYGRENLQPEKAGKTQFLKSFVIDAVLLAAVLCMWRSYKQSAVSVKRPSVFTYEAEAKVVDIARCEFTGTQEQAGEPGAAADAEYAVVLEYRAGGNVVRKTMYFRDKPEYRIGDIVPVRVSFFDKDDITVTGKAEQQAKNRLLCLEGGDLKGKMVETEW